MKRFILALFLLCGLAGPAWALDPDGTQLTCGTASTITNAAGIWSCPGPASGVDSTYDVKLNGVSTGTIGNVGHTGGANIIRIAGSGALYAMGMRNFWSGQWYKWAGFWEEETPQQLEVFNMHATVRNAPGWIHSHVYHYGDSVNNGAGWNEGTGKFVSDQTLRAYRINQGTSPDPCTSAASGGPTSQGSNITDGTCHWDWSSDTDYVTLTGYFNDAPRWTADFYGFMEHVTAPNANGVLTHYMQTNGIPYPIQDGNGGAPGCDGSGGNTNSPLPETARACGYNVTGGCNSTVAPPVGNAGCIWEVMQPVTYSSGRTANWFTSNATIYPPHQKFITGHESHSQWLNGYQANLWHDREYVLGQNGEGASGSLITDQHIAVNNDFVTLFENQNLGSVCSGFGIERGRGYACPFIVTAAPGESFADTLKANTSLPMSGYTPANGVALNGFFATGDDRINWRRMQLRNTSGPVVASLGRGYNAGVVEASIVEVGTSTPAGVTGPVLAGAALYFINSLIIDHNTSNGYITAYDGGVLNSTIVNPEGTGLVGNFTRHNWILLQGHYIFNSVFVGFQHSNASQTPDTDQSYWAAHAYTTSPNENLPPGTVPTFNAIWGDGTTVAVQEFPIPGMTYGISSSGLFTASNDYRIPNGSILHGAGAAYGDPRYSTATTINRCFTDRDIGNGERWPFNCEYNYYGTDILGNTRAASGTDVGAWQQTGAVPSTFTLTVATPSNGTITGSGISCPSTCTNTYAAGATVTLTATPSGGYQFTTWGGACTGGISPCSFAINSNQSVAANFAANSNPVSNRMSRITVRSPPVGQGPPPTVGLLQMPAGITGSQTVEAGTGPNTITMQFSKTHVEDADNHFVLYISTDGTTYTQITDTVNPMTVTGGYTNPDRFYAPQTFIFHGSWGPVDNVQFLKVVQTSAGSLNSLYTDQMQYGSTSFTYVGPSTKGGAPSQGYTNYNSAGLSPVIWSSCLTGTVAAPPGGGSGSWIDCPPVYNATPSQIAGATVDGVGVATGTLAQIIDPVGGGHDVVLPAGHFFGTGVMGQFDSGTVSGNRVHGQGQGTTIIDGKGISPSGFKGLFDFETYVNSLTDLTVTGGQIGGNADNPNNSSNAGCIYMQFAGYHLDNVELTKCQDGIRGGSVGDPISISNSYLHDNGSRTGFTHELYLAGGDQFFSLNNSKIVAGDRPGYALKVRFKTVVNGGYFSSCTDPTAQTCAGLLDFPNGDTVAIQGMNTVTVGGTIHAGDVQTMTFQHLSDTPIVVTAAATSTAQGSADALLTALKANSALATAGWVFHASMPAGGGSLIPNAVDLYAPYKLVDWTITPSVTGGGATTTLTKTMNPVTLVLNSNALVPNGSTQIVKCEEEFGPGGGGAACKMYLDNIIIDNRNSNAPRIAVGQWDSTPAMPGTELHISNCVYTGGIAPQITSNWATVTGSCTAAP